jgi:hypothetical protein
MPGWMRTPLGGQCHMFSLAKDFLNLGGLLALLVFSFLAAIGIRRHQRIRLLTKQVKQRLINP